MNYAGKILGSLITALGVGATGAVGTSQHLVKEQKRVVSRSGFDINNNKTLETFEAVRLIKSKFADANGKLSDDQFQKARKYGEDTFGCIHNNDSGHYGRALEIIMISQELKRSGNLDLLIANELDN